MFREYNSDLSSMRLDIVDAGMDESVDTQMEIK